MLASLMIALQLAATPSAEPRTFRLSGDRPAEGEIAVEPDRPYSPGSYGHEPGNRLDTTLFSVAVPEGNWRVTLILGDPRRAAETTVKAESRRLMLDKVRTRAGQQVTRSFVVNVRDAHLPPPETNAPGGSEVRLKSREVDSYTWDDRLTLEFLGTPAVQSVRIEPVDVPTLYLIGDSTVTDQGAEPAASWGQMLTAFLDDRVAVANHAESGETLKSFLTGLRLDKALSRMKVGDFLFIQFGHNDQKQQWPQTYAAADSTYPAYLTAYIAEARRRGATPVLVTSPERRNYDAEGRIKPSLAGYPDAVRRVAAEEKVPLVDLNRASVAIYEALGEDRAERAFNDGGKDRAHHNNYGAWLLARAVAEGARQAVPALAPHITAERFDPARPPLPGAVRIVPSGAVSDVRPAGN